MDQFPQMKAAANFGRHHGQMSPKESSETLEIDSVILSATKNPTRRSLSVAHVDSSLRSE
jgi:hypothetical protein